MFSFVQDGQTAHDIASPTAKLAMVAAEMKRNNTESESSKIPILK
jgi:hypothetical protein